MYKGKLTINKTNTFGGDIIPTFIFVVESQEELIKLSDAIYTSRVYPYIAKEGSHDWVSFFHNQERERRNQINVVHTYKSYINSVIALVEGNSYIGLCTKYMQHKLKFILKYKYKLNKLKGQASIFFTVEEAIPFLDIEEGVHIMNRNKS